MRQSNLPRYIKKNTKIQDLSFGHFVSDLGKKLSDFGQNGGFWRLRCKLQPLKFQCFAVILTLPRGNVIEKQQEGNYMSAIQIDDGYLIINTDTTGTNHAAGIVSVSENDTACEITFDTEKAAGTVMDQLAEALCGKWLDAGMEEQLS